MKDQNHNLFIQRDLEPLVKPLGRVTHLESIKQGLQSIHFNDETSFMIDLQSGSLSNQASLCKLLGYCEELKSLLELKKICHVDHFSHVMHVCKTYIKFCEKQLLIQDLSSLSLTFKIRKNNGSFIKIFCQISVCESHENQLTKLLVKFTNIDFISSDCDLSWALQADPIDKLNFKNLVATKFIHTFSARENDIIKEVFKGNSNHQIGKKLFISNHTVATHRKNIFKKSNCNSVASLFSYCRQRGLI